MVRPSDETCSWDQMGKTRLIVCSHRLNMVKKVRQMSGMIIVRDALGKISGSITSDS